MRLYKNETNNSFQQFSRHIKISADMDAAELYEDYLLWCDPRINILTDEAFNNALCVYVNSKGKIRG